MTMPVHPTCPSAQAHLPGAKVFAVVGGTVEQPEVAYLDEALPITPELVALAGPVDPAEVFRISAPCVRDGGCAHYSTTQHKCRLAQRTVALTPVVVSKPPRCAIRQTCQWWAQEGVSACLRCPQVVTNNMAPTETAAVAADPDNLAYGL